MKRHGHDVVVARGDPMVEARPFIDFSSGYVQRAAGLLPKQGARTPWRLYQNYVRDLVMLRHRPLVDVFRERVRHRDSCRSRGGWARRNPLLPCTVQRGS